MSRRGILILVGSPLAGLMFLALLFWGLTPRRAPRGPRPPELGGQQVPDTVYEIRFDRRYDLFCSFFRDEPTIYRNCRILGFTGRGEESSESAGTSGSGGFSGLSGFASTVSYTNYFDHWLVLKLADGRLAYIPPGAVKYIEEASSKGK
jgi:hypothetical protein